MRRRNVDNETEANLYAQLRITNAAGANVEENLSNTNLDQPLLLLLLRSALFPLMQMDGQSLNGVPRPESGGKDAGRGGGGGGNRKVHLTDRMPARPPNENEALL